MTETLLSFKLLTHTHQTQSYVIAREYSECLKIKTGLSVKFKEKGIRNLYKKFKNSSDDDSSKNEGQLIK